MRKRALTFMLLAAFGLGAKPQAGSTRTDRPRKYTDQRKAEAQAKRARKAAKRAKGVRA